MNSGRFLLAVVLMIAVMVITNLLFPPPPRPGPAVMPDTLSTEVEATSPRPAAPPAAAPADTPVLPGLAPQSPPATQFETAAADTIVVRSNLYEYRISTLGASLVGAKLLEYEVLPHREDERVELSPTELPGLFSYVLRIGTREIDLETLPFTPAEPGDVFLSTGEGPRTVTLQHVSGDVRIGVAYTFDPARYTVEARMELQGLGGQTPTLQVRLPSTLRINEAVPQEDQRALAYVVFSEVAGINSERLGAIRAQRIENGPLGWAAVKNKYFVAAVFAHPETQRAFATLAADPVPQENAARITATGLLPGPDGTFALRYYIGPQEPARLAELGTRFEDVNPFGWRLFRPVLGPLGHGISWLLYRMHDGFGLGYGWVLILFGVLIRIVLWPLNAKAMRSQMKNMEIQPKLKEIQTKYKNNPEQLQKEMLRLYKEEGFNPMGGCLPMLIPLPILITLFFVFQSTIAFRGVEFLWLPDLSQKDPLYILPVLLGVSMFLMQWLSSRTAVDQNPQMKFLMYFMPIFMTVIFLNFASGLNLYYAAMNFASIPQQLQIMRERKRYMQARGLAKA